MAGWSPDKDATPVVSVSGRGRCSGGQRRPRRRPGKIDRSRSSYPQRPQEPPARNLATLAPAVEDRVGSLGGRTLMTLVHVSGLLILFALLGCQRAAPVNIQE